MSFAAARPAVGDACRADPAWRGPQQVRRTAIVPESGAHHPAVDIGPANPKT
ncbi:hypothetical protein MINTM005_08950 [Mycobacterium intracellulare]|nr:hypothetical protein MINTM005_08950 [Mycobacterium intracellulare]BCO92915.1 hypothetical protein MINTM016_08910 [Mycobacterium intracellulare]